MTEEQALAELTKLAELGPDEYFHRAESKEIVAETMVWLTKLLNARYRIIKLAKAIENGSHFAYANAVHPGDYGKFDEKKEVQRIEKKKLKKGVITHD